MSKPLVTCIITAYNGENYVSEAIQSVLDQDYCPKEIIVVNDGSIDNTANILDSFGSKLRAIYQENQGAGAARNTGVKASNGEYLAFLDHDDLWDAHKLTDQMDAIDQQAERDPIIFTEVKQFICDRLIESEKQQLRVQQETPMAGYLPSTVLLSRRRFEQIGFFQDKKQLGEFIEWYMRALEKKIPAVMIEKVLTYRRVHLNNMGRNKEIYHRSSYLKILQEGLARQRALKQVSGECHEAT